MQTTAFIDRILKNHDIGGFVIATEQSETSCSMKMLKDGVNESKIVSCIGFACI